METANGRMWGPEIKSVKGKTGASYLIFRTHDGRFHVFRRIDAREAALDCGAGAASNGQEMLEEIWESQHGLGQAMMETAGGPEG
jgi:hypothetical protein